MHRNQASRGCLPLHRQICNRLATLIDSLERLRQRGDKGASATVSDGCAREQGILGRFMSDTVTIPALPGVVRSGSGPGALTPGHRLATHAAQDRTARNGIYLAAWGLVALAAAAYLAAVVLKPRVLTEWFPAVGRILTQPQGNDHNHSESSAELSKLREVLQQKQDEVAQLRHELATRDAQIKTSELRITGLEKELETARGSASVAPVEAGTAPATTTAQSNARSLSESIGKPQEPAAAKPSEPLRFELVNGQQPAGAGAQTDVDVPVPGRRPPVPAVKKPSPIAQLTRPSVPVAPSTASAIETGSVASTAAKTAKAAKPLSVEELAAQDAANNFGATVTRSPKQVGVRLTAGPSVDALRLSWNLMSERHSAELSGLQPRYLAGSTPSSPYSLMAGPVANEKEAHRICGSLQAKGTPCTVEAFSGNSL